MTDDKALEIWRTAAITCFTLILSLLGCIFTMKSNTVSASDITNIQKKLDAHDESLKEVNNSLMTLHDDMGGVKATLNMITNGQAKQQQYQSSHPN